MNVFKRGHGPDYLILISFGLLVAFGLVMLASASSHLGAAQFNDSYFYLKRQLINGFAVGLIAFLLASKINYRFYSSRWFSVSFLLFTVILLLLVFSPLGFSAKGATRWLALGPFSFQPAELLKLSLVIYFASWLSQRNYRQKNFTKGLLPFLVVLGIISGILVMQRSTSPVAILVAVSLIMYFMSGARWRYILSVLFLAAAGLASIIVVTPYRFRRILSFLNPEADPGGSGFHTLQAKTAIGTGGLTGVGYGQSTVKFYLPEPIGDSIFAVIAEEMGFIGAIILIALFAVLVIRIFLLTSSVRDGFGKLLLIGFGSVIGLQAAVNIGAMSGILPLTGTPLPFISLGGTALVIFMTMIGISINISKFSSKY